jgi:hypothetical protein
VIWLAGRLIGDQRLVTWRQGVPPRPARVGQGLLVEVPEQAQAGQSTVGVDVEPD